MVMPMSCSLVVPIGDLERDGAGDVDGEEGRLDVDADARDDVAEDVSRDDAPDGDVGPDVETDADADADADAGADVDEDTADLDGTDADEADPTCPEGMVIIPAGPFVMGSDAGEGLSDEEPERIVTLSSYCIGVNEVTNSEWRACVAAGPCVEATAYVGPDDYPVAQVPWAAMETYCAWIGGRLPTEAEWEKAARGGCEVILPDTCGPEDERTYPWGDDPPTCDRANYIDCHAPAELDPVGTHPTGDSPYGIHDMAGNRWEWVADWYALYEACPAACTDPTGPSSGVAKAARGGSSGNSMDYLRLARRDTNWIPTFVGGVGFRCAADKP